MPLTSPLPQLLFDDPIVGYQQIAATLQPGQRFQQQFLYETVENPEASAYEYLEILYPNATVLGADGDIGAWEINQSALGSCGHFSEVAAYASPKGEYRLETGIYPTEISPISLYLVRIQDPENPLGTKWIAIDSRMPIKPGGKSSYFMGVSSSGAIAPLLAIKAKSSAKGGCFDEITNTPALNIGFNWFPSTKIQVSTFEEFASAIERGGLCVYSLTQQYDGTTPITPPGVVYGHGYSAPDTLKTVEPDGTETKLVFMSNPWGGGSDALSPFADDSPWWDTHPELAEKVAASRQSKGEYWVTWDMFCQLTGQTTYEVRVPLPLPEYPYIKCIKRSFTDETAIASASNPFNLIKLGQRLNDVIEVSLTQSSLMQCELKWASGSGNRNTSIVATDANNNALTRTNTVFWGASKTVPLSLKAKIGTYKLYPYTEAQETDRGELWVMFLSKVPFEMKVGGVPV